MAGSEISIVVPTYNEAANVDPLLANVGGALSAFDWEVLFVDDNSPDGTADIARRASLNSDRVRLVLRLADRGLARASIQGMLSAKGDFICVMDGDGQHDAATVGRMAEELRNSDLDIVSAARQLDAGVSEASLGSFRQTLSRLGNRLSSLVLGRTLADPLTGFFMMRREAFLRVAPALRDPGFKLLLDILASGKDLKHREVPFEFGERMHGESKLDSYVAWQFATYLLSRLVGGIVPASFISFVIVGSTGIFVHLAALYAVLAAGGGFVAAQLCAAVLAASSNFLLNNRLTFRDKRLRGSALSLGYLKFLLISSVGLAANVSVATLAYERIGQFALPAAFAGILMDTVWKFVVSSRLVWR